MNFFNARATHWYYPFKITRNTQSLGLWFPILFNVNVVNYVYCSFSNYTFNGFVYHLYVT